MSGPAPEHGGAPGAPDGGRRGDGDVPEPVAAAAAPGADGAAGPAGTTGRPAARSGLAAVAGPDFSVAEALGGPRGIAEVALPTLVFVTVFSLTRDLRTAGLAAVGASVVLVLARVVTRSSPNQALSGLVGVAVCALVASRTGEARDFFALGLLTNVVYAAVYAVSTLPTPGFRVPFTQGRRRVPAGPWPVLGLALGFVTGEGLAWKQDPRRLRVYVQVTWVWISVFVLRLLVQGPLYLADAVGALGVARLFMGFPLFGLAAYVTWVLVRRVPATRPEDVAGR